MDEDPIFTVFTPADCDQISGLEKPEFPDLDCPVGLEHRYTVHAGMPGKDPLSLGDLEIFRVYRGCVIALRRHTGPFDFFELHWRGVIEG